MIVDRDGDVHLPPLGPNFERLGDVARDRSKRHGSRGRCVLLGLFETATAKMRVFRVPNYLGAALMLGLLGTLLLFVSRFL